MKKFVWILLLMAMPTLTERATAQETATDTTVYEVVEKWPEYPGGFEQLYRDMHTFARKYIKEYFPDEKN